MYNSHRAFRYSPVPISLGIVVILALTYIGLIATVMSYAALTVEFSQSVRNDEAAVAKLESRYLAVVSQITSINPEVAGYEKPTTLIYVPTKRATALR